MIPEHHTSTAVHTCTECPLLTPGPLHKDAHKHPDALHEASHNRSHGGSLHHCNPPQEPKPLHEDSFARGCSQAGDPFA